MKTNETQTPTPQRVIGVPNPDRYCGCVVTKSGERPITDDMVLRACRALESITFPFRELTVNRDLH